MQTLNLTEAAQFLKIHPETLKQRAKANQIPGAKIGRAWVFIDQDLAEYIRKQYNTKRDAKQGDKQQCQKSHSTNAQIVPISGTASQRQMAKEYDDLLKPATKQKPKK